MQLYSGLSVASHHSAFAFFFLLLIRYLVLGKGSSAYSGRLPIRPPIVLPASMYLTELRHCLLPTSNPDFWALREKEAKNGYASAGSPLLAPDGRVNAPLAVETLAFPSFSPGTQRRLICRY
jgi:hypothetical protein